MMKLCDQTNSQCLDITIMPFWVDISQQFSVLEQNKIIQELNAMVNQFTGDIPYSEQIQIVDAIKMGVLLDRVNSTKLPSVVENTAGIVKATADILEKLNQGLVSERQKIFKEMKALRNQRIKNEESTTENFNQWLQQLINRRDMQTRLGIRMAKMRLAMEQERKRLSEYHEYEDKTIDRPFLTPDVVLEKGV